MPASASSSQCWGAVVKATLSAVCLVCRALVRFIRRWGLMVQEAMEGTPCQIRCKTGLLRFCLLE